MYKVLLMTACLLLASCGNVDVDHYARETPALDLAAFFSRPVQAWGMFQKRCMRFLSVKPTSSAWASI